MAVTSGQVAVGSTAVSLGPVETGGTPGPTKMLIKNTDGATAVHLGDSSVTSSTGFTLGSAAQITVELTQGEELFAIGPPVGSVSVHVLRTGV